MDKYGDIIDELPVDNNQPKHDELRIVNTLFKENEGTMTKIGRELKDLFVIGILFILFSLPQVDNMIKKVFPPAVNSIYILVGIKTLIVMVLFWVIKYFYLSKKSN